MDRLVEIEEAESWEDYDIKTSKTLFDEEECKRVFDVIYSKYPSVVECAFATLLCKRIFDDIDSKYEEET